MLRTFYQIKRKENVKNSIKVSKEQSSMWYRLDDDKILEARDVEVKFYTYAGVVHAVSKVSMYVKENEVVAIVGETGSGKTVFTRALTKLIDPPGRIEGGVVLFRRKDGSVVNLFELSENELRKIRGYEIAYIFQDPTAALDPLFTVGYHISETITSHRKVDRKKLNIEVVELLSKVLIPEPKVRIKNYPHELSGGMRQRVVIATSISNTPRLLIADEPTTNLDVTVQAQILDLLRSIKESYKMSIILITHNFGIVAELADRVYVMYAGKVVETGTVYDIFENPQHPYTSLLLRTIPNPLRKVEKLESIPGSVPSLIDPPPGCRFHPRCPYAMEICKKEEPPSIRIDSNHEVSCWLLSKR